MHGAIGQKYVINVFGRGIAQDLLYDLPIGQMRDTYIRSDRLAINQDLINALKAVTGDVKVGLNIFSTATSITLLALLEMGGYLYTFWANSSDLIYIYRDYTLLGEHLDYPGGFTSLYLYIDGNPDSNEIAITDGDRTPIILDMDDMYAEVATITYKAGYDYTLYEVNQDVGLHQPRFVSLNDVGSGGGVRVGSYSYASRLVSAAGDETPWSPNTPFIPVPERSGGFSGDAGDVWPGAKLYGAEPSLTGSRYGINLKIRVANESGFDYLEIKRIANNVGGPVDYTASAEYLRYPASISGIKYSIIEFSDVAGLSWATLDESNTITNSIIDTCRTVRFHGGRLVLGGVKYKSVTFDSSSLFNNIGSVGAAACAFKEDIGIGGYKNISNQVYKKSYRLGERYGFGVTPRDIAGNTLYAVPIEGFSNYLFPDRRDNFASAAIQAYSPDVTETPATVDSYNGADLDETYEVYEQGTTQKLYSLSGIGAIWNILINADNAAGTTLREYRPITPTGRDSGYAGNGNDSKFHEVTPNVQLEGATTYQPDNFGHTIMGTGLKLGGVDTAEFPSHIAGFSVMRTPPAGRVVTQGLAMYALTEHDGTNLTKALNKVWLMAPELDSVIGDKSSLYEDIKANPGDYEMQLVSPVGFNTEMYSGFSGTGPAWGKQDMVSYANCYYGASNSHPHDSAAQVGRGDGYVSFGMWRNTVAQSAGIDSSLTFGISAAGDVGISGKNGRFEYLELTLDGDLYLYPDPNGSVDGDHADSRNFHEPWYVVNIVKDGKVIAQNNTNLYQEIGQYIKLASAIEEGTGAADQEYELVSERWEDVYNLTGAVASASTIRYIYVNGQKWMDGTNVASGTVTTWRTAMESTGHFTVLSVDYYGIYSVGVVGDVYTITFPYLTTPSSNIIVPALGHKIEIYYNNNSPIDVWGGDTIIDEVPVGIIDCETSDDWDASTSEKAEHFRISAPLPAYSYLTGGATAYYQAKDYSVGTKRYESGATILLQYLRQWATTFMMESTLNLPFVFKDFYPHRHYVMRPMKYDEKQGDETVSEYLTSINIHSAYNTDYPDEYQNWGYGGIHLPQGYNFDHNKTLARQFGSEPASGLTEILDYPKRLHWSAKQSAGLYGLGIIKTFLATNVYDIQFKDASEINILYDQYTGKGNNLYAVMDRGVIGLITDKTLLRDGLSDELGVLLSEAGFIQGELWIDPFVGTPDRRWRGRAEGTIKTSQNVHVPGLVFVGDDDIHLLSGNSVVSLGTNFRATLRSLITSITDSTLLTAAIYPDRNELWVKIGSDIYVYGFGINNWVAKISGTRLVGLTSSKVYNNTRLARLGVVKHLYETYNTAFIVKGDDGFDWASDFGLGENPVSSVDLAITPVPGQQVEFTDIFVNSSIRPATIYAAVTDDFVTDFFSIGGADIKNINGLYRATIGRTNTVGNKLIGNTLYVRIAFTTETEVDLGYVKTGYKNIVGN